MASIAYFLSNNVRFNFSNVVIRNKFIKQKAHLFQILIAVNVILKEEIIIMTMSVGVISIISSVIVKRVDSKTHGINE